MVIFAKFIHFTTAYPLYIPFFKNVLQTYFLHRCGSTDNRRASLILQKQNEDVSIRLKRNFYLLKITNEQKLSTYHLNQMLSRYHAIFIQRLIHFIFKNAIIKRFRSHTGIQILNEMISNRLHVKVLKGPQDYEIYLRHLFLFKFITSLTPLMYGT